MEQLAKYTCRMRNVAIILPCLLLTAPTRAHAQIVPGEGSRIGSLSADRARIDQITGRTTDSTSAASASRTIEPILPTLRAKYNSELPTGGNDGALWAGRGVSTSVSGGFSYVRQLGGRPLSVRVEPELTFSANRSMPVIPSREPGRSAFSSPFHSGDMSADLPLRFGDRPIRTIGLGQSSITYTTSRVAFGAASTNEWWGPALLNTLLLSNNAAGVPRFFARTAQPVRTRYGNFEGRAFIGGLTESPYFDLNSTNNVRSLSGVLVTYRPSIDTGLTLGVSRLVMAPVSSTAEVLPHLLDALVRYEPIGGSSDTTKTGEIRQSTDQLFSLFARWVFPESGFETWAEWSRMELPRSFRQYLEIPQHTQGYSLGLQWANTLSKDRHFRLQTEVTYLEQTQVIPNRPTRDYYTGRAAVQGFTQRGQVLGASIGPGSSSQYAGADWLKRSWQAGVFAGRIRSENDALYREGGPRNTQHDVTVYAGIRGGARMPRADISASLTKGRRLNYLHQSDYYIGFPVVASDFRNTTFSLRVSPR